MCPLEASVYVCITVSQLSFDLLNSRYLHSIRSGQSNGKEGGGGNRENGGMVCEVWEPKATWDKRASNRNNMSTWEQSADA